MITKSDSQSTIDLGEYYAILPPDSKDISKYNALGVDPKYVDKEFFYSSENNYRFLDINEIRDLIKENIDINFQPI